MQPQVKYWGNWHGGRSVTCYWPTRSVPVSILTTMKRQSACLLKRVQHCKISSDICDRFTTDSNIDIWLCYRNSDFRLNVALRWCYLKHLIFSLGFHCCHLVVQSQVTQIFTWFLRVPHGFSFVTQIFTWFTAILWLCFCKYLRFVLGFHHCHLTGIVTEIFTWFTAILWLCFCKYLRFALGFHHYHLIFTWFPLLPSGSAIVAQIVTWFPLLPSGCAIVGSYEVSQSVSPQTKRVMCVRYYRGVL